MSNNYYSSPIEFQEGDPKLFDEFFNDYFGSHMSIDDIDEQQAFVIHESLEDYVYYLATELDLFGFNLEDGGGWPNVMSYIDWGSLANDFEQAGSDDSFFHASDDRVVEFVGGLN